MREIKFRFYVKEGLNLDQVGYIYSDDYNYYNVENVSCFGEEIILEQYTGLKDKNGVERYEGNLFKTQVCLSPDGISSAHNIFYWIDVICEIVFYDGCFVGRWRIEEKEIKDYIFSNRQGYVRLDDAQEDIGNIHENKDLIK